MTPRTADKLTPVRDLEVGAEFSHKGSMHTVTYKDESRVEARSHQFSSISTFVNPTRPENFNYNGHTWYTGVRKM